MIAVGTLIQNTNELAGEWIARVLEVNEEANELKVQITSETSGQWFETWNLAHTISGFNQGEYRALGKCND